MIGLVEVVHGLVRAIAVAVGESLWGSRIMAIAVSMEESLRGEGRGKQGGCQCGWGSRSVVMVAGHPVHSLDSDKRKKKELTFKM
jgi:hypothetical protein